MYSHLNYRTKKWNKNHRLYNHKKPYTFRKSTMKKITQYFEPPNVTKTFSQQIIVTE